MSPLILHQLWKVSTLSGLKITKVFESTFEIMEDLHQGMTQIHSHRHSIWRVVKLEEVNNTEGDVMKSSSSVKMLAMEHGLDFLY